MSKGDRTIEVTTSQINSFKNCRKKFWFSYRELLKPVKESEALETGSSYHAKVEEILKTGNFTESMDKTDAMARAFIKYILPKLPQNIEPEVEFKYRLARGVYLKGKIDGICSDYLIEHKTTSAKVDNKYLYRVNFMNDQVSNYLIATGKNIPILYTVIQKPTIKLKKTETLKEYIQRCEEWYDTDTDTKINVFEVYRTDEELIEKKKELLEFAKEIKKTDKNKFFYRNDQACMILGCEFSSICNSYNCASNLVDFYKKEVVNEELSQNKKAWL